MSLAYHDVIKWKHFPRYWPLWGESNGTGGFPSQRPVTWSFDVFLDLRLNKRLSKQSKYRWFETPSRSLWRHCNAHDNWCTQRSCCMIHKIKCIICINVTTTPMNREAWTAFSKGSYLWCIALSVDAMAEQLYDQIITTRFVIAILWYLYSSIHGPLFWTTCLRWILPAIKAAWLCHHLSNATCIYF